MVDGCCLVHHVVRKSSLPWQLRAGDHRQRHQGWLSFQSRAFLEALARCQGVPAMPHCEECEPAFHSRTSLRPPLDLRQWPTQKRQPERRDLFRNVGDSESGKDAESGVAVHEPERAAAQPSQASGEFYQCRWSWQWPTSARHFPIMSKGSKYANYG